MKTSNFHYEIACFFYGVKKQKIKYIANRQNVTPMSASLQERF